MQDNGGVAWSPILGQGNFHKASRFGRIAWVTERKPEPVASSDVAPETASPGARKTSVSTNGLRAAPPATKPASAKSP
jgi:hypothetical protein